MPEKKKYDGKTMEELSIELESLKRENAELRIKKKEIPDLDQHCTVKGMKESQRIAKMGHLFHVIG